MKTLTILCSAAVFLMSSGCVSPRTCPPEQPVYQVSTIDTLLAGNFDAVTTVGELTEYGDFGIGTFTGLGGELIVVDGKAYDCRYDGRVVEAAATRGVPYATVTRFQPETTVQELSVASFAELGQKLDAALPSPNHFYAVRIDGDFEYVHCRSIPPQSKPYPTLAEAAKQQGEFEYRRVSGTLVGFRSPPWSRGISVPGWHLHFLVRDGQGGGGHVLDLRFAKLTARLDQGQEFHLSLPDSEGFAKTNLGLDRQQELKQVEQSSKGGTGK